MNARISVESMLIHTGKSLGGSICRRKKMREWVSCSTFFLCVIQYLVPCGKICVMTVLNDTFGFWLQVS